MATILPMSQDSLVPAPLPLGHSANPASRGAPDPATTASSLDQIASAALADAAESDSSQGSLRRLNGTQLVANSSNVSLEGSQTDDTSPKSALSVRQEPQRIRTPEGQMMGASHASTSPQENVLKQGTKRTVSGAFKDIDIPSGLAHAPATSAYGPSRGHVRAKSSSRAVEISSALKTRLAYAMVKVNNGWENQNIDQLEHISRMSSPSTTSPLATSPSKRRFSMDLEYNDRYMMSPDMQRNSYQNASRSAYQPAPYSNHAGAIIEAAPVYSTSNGAPSLAPAAPIAAGRSHRRSLSTKAPPMLSTSHLRHAADYGSQPTTPRRQGILRMPSQQAEKDALDSLLFMASPNNSSSLKYTNSPAGPSPLRSEFPPAVKRVVFEH